MAVKPEKIFPITRGKSVYYQGVCITLDQSGNLKVNGTSDPKCVQFSRSGGVSSSWRGYAVLEGNQVFVFEGAAIGPTMLTRERVLTACSQG